MGKAALEAEGRSYVTQRAGEEMPEKSIDLDLAVPAPATS